MNLPPVLTRDPSGYVHFTGHRIGLTHLIWSIREGQSVDQLLETFPTLSRQKIEAALAFIAENADDVNAYVEWEEKLMAENRAKWNKGVTIEEMKRRLQELRARMAAGQTE